MIQVRTIALTIIATLLVGCASGSGPTAGPLPSNGDPAPVNMEVATDSTYGYTAANPVKVGGVRAERGVQNERAYLGALGGPNGERVTYQRLGSCCEFSTPNGLVLNSGMLDQYELTWEGQAAPIVLYINMYDYQTPKVPRGLTRAGTPGSPRAGRGLLRQPAILRLDQPRALGTTQAYALFSDEGGPG